MDRAYKIANRYSRTLIGHLHNDCITVKILYKDTRILVVLNN